MRTLDLFHTPDVIVRTGSSRSTAFVIGRLAKTPKPVNLRDRNLAQLLLAREFAKRFDVDEVSAVEAVAPLYCAKFPLPVH